MEIEFNPSRPTNSPASQPTTKSQSAAQTPEPMSLGNAESLKTAINNLPVSSPEQVERAQALVSDTAYPSNDVLNRIAGLLAKNIE